MEKNEKILKTRDILPGLFIIAIAIVPAAGAGTEEAKRVFPENDTAGYLPVDVITINPAIRDATPYYNFLIMSDEAKQIWLRDIDASIDSLNPDGAGREELKARVKGNMNAIRDKYPVVSETSPGGPGYPTYGGSFITVKFAPSLGNVRLTQEENDAIAECSSILNEAYAKRMSSGSPDMGNISPDSRASTMTMARPAPIPVVIPVTAFCLCAGGIAGIFRRFS
ncbi:MAG: hypothetical protein A4E35_01579 [Methanoregula sp. PtaU1.Bin051]|nr:MAG: hypothetical protein A4E35_01579 [Methanoregula sp. PtaU1.Bin051]